MNKRVLQLTDSVSDSTLAATLTLLNGSISSRGRMIGQSALLLLLVLSIGMNIALIMHFAQNSLPILPFESPQRPQQPDCPPRSLVTQYVTPDQAQIPTVQNPTPHLPYVSTGTSRDFLEIGKRLGTTDKIRGVVRYHECMADPQKCPHPTAKKPLCMFGANHFYHTIYNRWLAKYTTDDAAPFQFLEIGYYRGGGFDVYSEFLPQGEKHTMEISCIEAGSREEGKWPWGNFAANNKRYQELRNANRLHCGDASDYDFLYQTWTQHMQRPDAPPLKIVVDDASHLADHMAKSLFFWFPRIEPGGVLIMEDVQPIRTSNSFRIHILPQLLKDLHYCGVDKELPEEVCFPTIQPLLHSIHCEMHICVLERNLEPALTNLTRERSVPPKHAFDVKQCLLGTIER